MKSEIEILKSEYEHLRELKRECEKESIAIRLRIKEICEHENFSEPFPEIPDKTILLKMCLDCSKVVRAN